jgi:hypothetical protein
VLCNSAGPYVPRTCQTRTRKLYKDKSNLPANFLTYRRKKLFIDLISHRHPTFPENGALSILIASGDVEWTLSIEIDITAICMQSNWTRMSSGTIICWLNGSPD